MRIGAFRILLGFLPVIVTLITLSGQPGRSQTTVAPSDTALVRELRELDRSIDVAYLRADKQLFERLLADDMLAVSAQGDVSGKADLLKQIDRPSNMSVSAADVLVRLFGSTAIVSSRKTLHSSSTPSDSFQYRETNTYALRGGRWLLISSQQAEFPRPYSPKTVDIVYTIDPKLMKGDKNAGVVLIEFIDYECPRCRNFAAETLPQLEKNYIAPGKIGFALHQSPGVNIHPLAFKAAEAALCAKRQGKLWEMTGALNSEPLALNEADLLKHARSIKLDEKKFSTCLTKEATAGEIRKAMSKASELDIKGTPIFLIGVREQGSGTVHVTRMIEGDYPYEVFRGALEASLSPGGH